MKPAKCASIWAEALRIARALGLPENSLSLRIETTSDAPVRVEEIGLMVK